MRHAHWTVPLLAGAVLLAACGGGDSPSQTPITVERVNALGRAPSAPPGGGFKGMVAFGDSLSDDGAYSIVAILPKPVRPPYPMPFELGGQFSVNGPESANWTDRVAHQLGLQLSPNLVGFAAPNDPTKAVYLTRSRPTLSLAQAYCGFNTMGGSADCTNFAQGGARIRDPQGIGHSDGALTYPLTMQLQNFLTQFGGFSSAQLVTVLGGANDVIVAGQQLQAQVRAGASRNESMQQAQAAVATAADDLGALVRTMLGQGASYLLVYTLPDIALTPGGQRMGSNGRCDRRDPNQDCFALSNLVQLFNQRLLTQIAGLPVRVVDGYSLLEREVAAPQQFGLSNVTAPWCDAAQTNATALLCHAGTPNAAAGASPANVDAWLFADDLHPTPAGHRIVASATLDAMRGFGWLR